MGWEGGPEREGESRGEKGKHEDVRKLPGVRSLYLETEAVFRGIFFSWSSNDTI